MKKAVPALLSIGLIAASVSAMAEGESVDLTVTGSVVPSACVPVLDNGGKLDWGKIPSSSLNEDTPTPLDGKTLQLTVTCVAPTQFAMAITDNKTDSAGSNENGWDRGLGLVSGTTTPIGNYSLFAGDLTADGGGAAMLVSEDNGENWVSQSGGIRTTTWVALVKHGAQTPLVPSSITNAVVKLFAHGAITPKNLLPVGNEDITLDGSSTFEIKYL